MTDADRFWSRVVKTDGCWLWTGPLSNGYGLHTVAGRKVRAHRFAYVESVSVIPAGLVLDHLCHGRDDSCAGGTDCPHRRCVRPDHLEPVSHRANILRGRGITAALAAKMTCDLGHVLVEVRGARRCPMCTRKVNRTRRERLRDRFLAGEPSGTRHGTVSGANFGCCCTPCVEAGRVYRRRLHRPQGIGEEAAC